MSSDGAVGARPLAPGDRAAWGRLWTLYLDFYGTWLPAAVHDAQWARLMESGAFWGLVAERDARVVGIANCIEHGHGWRLEPVTYLQDLFADPEARGQGVGRALIEAVYAEADRRGAPHVHWLTDEANVTARALYDRVGVLSPFVKYVRPS